MDQLAIYRSELVLTTTYQQSRGDAMDQTAPQSTKYTLILSNHCIWVRRQELRRHGE